MEEIFVKSIHIDWAFMMIEQHSFISDLLYGIMVNRILF